MLKTSFNDEFIKTEEKNCQKLVFIKKKKKKNHSHSHTIYFL